jgi:hypothetical protein
LCGDLGGGKRNCKDVETIQSQEHRGDGDDQDLAGVVRDDQGDGVRA